jgi:cyclopropane-fatty-acyl-phospholipid synthase
MENSDIGGASPSEIQAHYDVSNDFYKLWLDPALVYSAAMWTDLADQSLAEAQANKLNYHLHQAHAETAEFLLDIGCGWGALLNSWLKLVPQGQGVGLTLSQTQKEHIEAQDLPVQILLESWETYTPPQAIDAIISIGAFEHFARPGMSPEAKHVAYSNFFSKCSDWLKTGGRCSLQSIGYGFISEEMKQKISALNQAVFPGSELPTLLELISSAEPFFDIVQIRNDRMDYAKTCQLWRKNLRNQKETIVEVFGEALYKRYQEYLIASEMGFRMGNLNLYRITLEKTK